MSAPILITGAFGQVGKRVTELLPARGHTVVATDLHTDSVRATAEKLAETPQPGTVRTTFADLLDRAAVEALVDEHRPGTIIHLAAMFSPQSNRNPQLARPQTKGELSDGRKVPASSIMMLLIGAANHDVSVRSHSRTVLTAEEKLAAFHAQISAVAGAGR
ncbi:NAD-dependent epimerase/dehydratase family protein [Nocardia fusca]|uniref:NAD-dependent epimerase/dehydratase family protein n=1 Tax=Nocardia fusca TaxID=941183 RepID=UPI000A8A6C99|nr:NAD-dependent epimerase/dehydratase family protein [Nocardia fusca]